MSARKLIGLGEVADALSGMIDLADAWATCGPEGYTKDERRRRNRADRVLMRLYARIEVTIRRRPRGSWIAAISPLSPPAFS